MSSSQEKERDATPGLAAKKSTMSGRRVTDELMGLLWRYEIITLVGFPVSWGA